MSHRRSVRVNNNDARSKRSNSSYIGQPVPLPVQTQEDINLIEKRAQTMKNVVKLLADVKVADTSSHDKMLALLISDDLLM